MKKVKILILTLVLFSVPFFAFADNNQDNINVSQDEIIDGNLIKGANTITIDGVINGDVILVGINITISGSVTGDVFALASNIKITGDVQGSIRVAGGNIEISSRVERNVNVFGSSIAITEGAEIGWDLVAVGSKVEVKGKVLGNLNVTASNIILNNEVGKNANLYLGVDGRAILGQGAKINGNLTYQSAKADQININQEAQVLGLTKHTDVSLFKPKRETLDSLYFMGKLVSLFGLIIVGLVLITLIPRIVNQISTEMTSSPWRSLGWGILFLILTPLIILILLITIIGVPLAIILIVYYFTVIYLAYLLAAIAVGLKIVNRLSKSKSRKSLFWPMILGLIVLDIICSIPFIGWLIGFLAITWAIGALIEVKISILANYR